MLGFMTNEQNITFEFLLAVFVANFPEAFSAASLLRAQKVPIRRIFSMWMIVFVLTGLLPDFNPGHRPGGLTRPLPCQDDGLTLSIWQPVDGQAKRPADG